MDITLERILQLLKSTGKLQKELTDFLGISANSFTNWKSGLNSSYKKYIYAIAEFFKVSPSYLTEGIPQKIREHFVPSDIREDVKATNRKILNNYPKTTIDDCVKAQIKVFECLFSRSYESQGFNPNHISFDEYVSLLLGQKYTKENMNKEIFEMLVCKFGSKEGMKEGTTYAMVETNNKAEIINFPTADDIKFALFGGDSDVTDEMFEDVKQYAQFIKEKYKNNKD